MSIFKRLSTTLFSRIDHVVGEIENHEALIQATLTEQRRKIAAARIQLNRLQKNQAQVAEQIARCQADQEDWARRALACAPDDEDQALACMQRREQAQHRAARLAQVQAEYQQAAARMMTDIQQCEQSLDRMKQKHEVLRARQSSADALQAAGEFAESGAGDLEARFDRWELRIAAAEADVDDSRPVDELEQSFIDRETSERLKAELARLQEQEDKQ